MQGKVFLIKGKKRHGKNFTGRLLTNLLKRKGYSVVQYQFADTLKNIIADTFNISRDKLRTLKNDEELKLKIGNDNYGTFRKILQRFGSNAMKKFFGNDVWASRALKQMKNCYDDCIIITDWRYKVELQTLIDGGLNITTIDVSNPSIKNYDTHKSETELDDFNCDFLVTNDGHTRSNLKSQLSIILNKLTKEK